MRQNRVEVIFMRLNQKETQLLQDLRDQETLCVEKYTKHAGAAADKQLGQLLNRIAQVEQQHLDAINQLGQGQIPQMSAGGTQPSFTATYGVAQTPQKQNDCYLCTDLLATEKHASHLYDTCVFEFADGQVRSVLNQIQKQEQEHGKAIYDYMKTNSMYN